MIVQIKHMIGQFYKHTYTSVKYQKPIIFYFISIFIAYACI